MRSWPASSGHAARRYRNQSKASDLIDTTESSVRGTHGTGRHDRPQADAQLQEIGYEKPQRMGRSLLGPCRSNPCRGTATGKTDTTFGTNGVSETVAILTPIGLAVLGDGSVMAVNVLQQTAQFSASGALLPSVMGGAVSTVHIKARRSLKQTVTSWRPIPSGGRAASGIRM